MGDFIDDVLGIDPPPELPPIEIPEPEPVEPEPVTDEEDIEFDIRRQALQEAQRRGRASLIRQDDPAINATPTTGLSIR